MTVESCNVYVEPDPIHRSLSRPVCTEHGLIWGGYTMHVLAEKIAEEHLEQAGAGS